MLSRGNPASRLYRFVRSQHGARALPPGPPPTGRTHPLRAGQWPTEDCNTHGMPAAHVASASPRQDVPEPGQPTALLQSAPPRRKQRATLQSREQSRAGLLHPGASRPPRAVVQPIPTLARPHPHRSRPPWAPRLQSTAPSQSTVPDTQQSPLPVLMPQLAAHSSRALTVRRKSRSFLMANSRRCSAALGIGRGRARSSTRSPRA